MRITWLNMGKGRRGGTSGSTVVVGSRCCNQRKTNDAKGKGGRNMGDGGKYGAFPRKEAETLIVHITE